MKDYDKSESLERIQKMHGDKFQELTEKELKTELLLDELAHILVQVFREQDEANESDASSYQLKRRGKLSELE
jgi:hypothetical protein